jgi:hypothetical protein
MEILEIGQLLWALVEACGCFLEFMAVSSNVGAVATAVKASKQTKARRAARESGQEVPQPATRWWALFGVLLFLGALLTGLVFLKWTR